MLNLIPLLSLPPAYRFIGTGEYGRMILLPAASLAIGTVIAISGGFDWYYAPILATLFALGRGPGYANGFTAITGEPFNSERDTWATRWISRLTEGVRSPKARGMVFMSLRGVYYAPMFIVIGFLSGSGVLATIVALGLFMALFGLSYRLSRPLCDRFGWNTIPNEYNIFAEWFSGTALMLCVGFLIAH